MHCIFAKYICKYTTEYCKKKKKIHFSVIFFIYIKMNDVTKRFLTFYNYLKDNKIVSNRDEFVKKIDISYSFMSELIKDRCNVGVNAIQNSVITYRINPYWILLGKGEMFINESEYNSYENKIQAPVIDEPKSEYKPNCKLCIEKDRIIESKEDTIIALKETVTQLKNNIDLLKK